MKKNTKISHIVEFLDRWTERIYPSKTAFLEALRRKKLVIYLGIDPTAPHLHLGHSTNLLLLREFQKLGHKIILLIGDFTAQIGDPTGRDQARKPLTRAQIMKNCRTYQKQAGKILDFFGSKNPAELKFNSRWLKKLKLDKLLKIASHFTYGFMIKRKMFQKRLKEGKEIYLHEFLYPLFQGYDSVAMNIDAEVGGTDQTFNMMVGRDLMKIYRKKEKFVITTPLLVNPKTGRKLMSKTESFIALDTPPDEMYGQIMALPDEVILDCFKLCTRIPLSEIKKIRKKLKTKTLNPRDAKAYLAREIVQMYHGKEKAFQAEKEFERVFKEKKLPSKIPRVKISEKTLKILDLLLKAKLAFSKSEAKRLILQGGVKIDGLTQKDWRKIIKVEKGMIVQVGKRKFVKIVSE